MAIDGITLLAAVTEAKEMLIGARIIKVLQPERDELALVVNGERAKSARLLISASPEYCRIHMSAQKKENPGTAPMFCMLLRKHLIGGKILSVTQPNSDRIAVFEIESTDELYSINRYKLIVEIMGRHSNIMLVGNDSVILDSIRHVNSAMSSARIVMPNTTYEYPPTAIKSDPIFASETDFYNVLAVDGRIDKLLSAAFYGIAPNIMQLLLATFDIDCSNTAELSDEQKHHIAQRLVGFYTDIVQGKLSPCIVVDDEKSPKQVLPFVPQLPERYIMRFSTMTEALDAFFHLRDAYEHIRRHAQTLVHALTLQAQRRENRIAMYDDAIASESDYEKYRLYGELITANLYRITPQAKFAVVENYYACPPEQIEIPLDPALSPSANAQRYYKKYQKAKSAREFALKNKEAAVAELEYIRSQIVNIARAETMSELAEIREELAEAGYIKPEKTKNGKKQKIERSEPRRFVSDDGFTILIGRNNKQNDYVTMRIAAPNDIWLHTKNIPGSHTIIVTEGRTVSDSTIVFAARLAAYFSDAKASENVPVDYTEKRFVKKPAGSLPGRVIYTNQHTVFVTPYTSIDNI